MEIAGIGQTTEIEHTISVAQEIKKLLKLQGELIVELIESARVPVPADTASITGMGTKIDFHI